LLNLNFIQGKGTSLVSWTVAVFLLASGLLKPALAAPIFNYPVTETQPDGTVVHLLASGDEFFNRLHDANGFTILRDPTNGKLVYADKIGEALVPTDLLVGHSDPIKVGLRPNLLPSPRLIQQKRMNLEPAVPMQLRSAPLTGILNNVVVFVRFADEDEFVEPMSVFERMFNDMEGAPSVRAYYREVSYQKLDVVTHFFPKPEGDQIFSYQSQHPRSYYRPYNVITNPNGYKDEVEAVLREQNLVRLALEEISHLITPDLNLDGDNDGFVDNVVVITTGGPDGWSELLWPHMSVLLADPMRINDLYVFSYNWLMADYLDNGKEVGVLCHELFHTLGAPDLYHYNHDGFRPVGPWDLMEWDASTPQHMSAWMKHRYGGWIDDIPEITTSGRYTLNPLVEPTGQAYKVAVPSDKRQFFILEYRLAEGLFESSLPGSGLLVHRINSRYMGNADGPPDEVYTLRPGGSPSSDGDINDAAFSADKGRTALNSETDPYPFLSDGQTVALDISNISEIGETISFDICLRFQACYQKNCGDDGCGGTCGECEPAQVCDEGVCSDEQGCGTAHACLSQCGQDDAECKDWCLRVPAVCPAPEKCHDEGTCNLDTGLCEYPVHKDHTPCDDKNACTRLDECIDGVCVGLDPVICPGEDQCVNEGKCNRRTGEYSKPLKDRGTPCDDGNACTKDDKCDRKGVCIGTEYSCDDRQCHTVACGGEDGCIYTPSDEGAQCDDGDPCTVDDKCNDGECVGVPMSCESSECADGVCKDGECLLDYFEPGTACDDGNPCTVDDRCNSEGVCVGTERDCGGTDAIDDVGEQEDSAEPEADTNDEPAKKSSSCMATSNVTGPWATTALLVLLALVIVSRRKNPV